MMCFSCFFSAVALVAVTKFGFEGMTENFVPGEGVSFDSSRAADRGKFRYGVARAAGTYGGDVRASATFEVGALDHWNGFRLVLSAANGGKWQAYASRHNAAPHDRKLTFRAGPEEKKTVFTTNAIGAVKLTLGVSRVGHEVKLAVREGDADTRVETFPCDYAGPLAVGIAFDSAAATRCKVRMTDFKVAAEKTYARALSPSYGPEEDFGACVYLGGKGGTRRVDGVLELRTGERALFALQAPLTARGWSLRWKSSGRLAVRSVLLGSAEAMQLSDNVVWDDLDAKVPDGYAARSVGLTPWITRFPSDVGWRYPHVTTSGLHFFEVFPTSDEPVAIGDVHLFGARVVAPPPLEKPSVSVKLSDLPRALSSARPSAEIAVGGKAGAFEVTHVAGRQPPASDPTLAAWLIVYADGTTEPAFATLRWNCGVNRSEDLEPGPGQGGPDNTWWGPPGFAWGAALYSPVDARATHWTAHYRWTLVNPRPEKPVRALQVMQLPEDARTYTVCSVKVRPPEETVLGLVDPERAAFDAGQTLPVRAYVYRASPQTTAEGVPLVMEKSATARETLAMVKMIRQGRLGAAFAEIVPQTAKLGPGAVTLTCGGATSSRCSLMPAPQTGDRPFYYCMISGGHDGFAEFNRMYRLGYDATKIHIGWTLDGEGRPDFSGWPVRFDRIARAGLKIAVRNLFSLPKEYEDRVPLMEMATMSETARLSTGGHFSRHRLDSFNDFYADRVVDYYRSFAKTVADNPNVVGINANYGCVTWSVQEGKEPFLLWSEARMAAFNAARREQGLGPVKPTEVAADPKLMAAYSRLVEGANNRLVRKVCEAIRSTGCKAHLTFNVNFHPVENKMKGHVLGEYLRIGRDLGPASPFHETSERYCLSFVKWLAAARTFGLLYGDECCQPPPTDEHAVLAYLWMGMMQCFESNYCQWWGGRPAPQNVAQLKAYHRLMYDAEYLCDPVCLAMSLQTGHDEISETAKHPLHTVSMAHYGLANFLRELNVNADRYMIDEFPEKDAAVTSKLLIDDIVRAMPADFTARIARFIRNGGAYLASQETDKVNGYAFFKSLGVADWKALDVKGEAVRYSEVPVGKGRLVILRGTWAYGWELNRPESSCREMRALLTRLGGFVPKVRSSVANVSVTPYRAKDGSVLVSAINTACVDRTVEVDVSRELFAAKPRVRDLGTGEDLAVSDAGAYWTVTTTVPHINTTVLKVCP